mgnify:CR=1 FL=1
MTKSLIKEIENKRIKRSFRSQEFSNSIKRLRALVDRENEKEKDLERQEKVKQSEEIVKYSLEDYEDIFKKYTKKLESLLN